MPRKRRRKTTSQKGGGEPLLQENPMYEKGGGSKDSLIPKKENKTGFNNKKFQQLTGKASNFASSLGFPGMCIMAAFITATVFFIIALAHISDGDSSSYLSKMYIISSHVRHISTLSLSIVISLHLITKDIKQFVMFKVMFQVISC